MLIPLNFLFYQALFDFNLLCKNYGMVLALLLIFTSPTANASTAPSAQCVEQIQQKLRNNPTYFKKFRVLNGELSGRKILSFTLRNPKEKKLQWKDHLTILRAVDDGLKNCQESPFSTLLISFLPTKKMLISNAWSIEDIRAVHSLGNRTESWESNMKLRTQSTHAKIP